MLWRKKKLIIDIEKPVKEKKVQYGILVNGQHCVVNTEKEADILIELEKEYAKERKKQFMEY